MSSNITRVRSLYKTFLYYGKDWPEASGGYPLFRKRCKQAFDRNKDVKDPEEIEKLLKRGEFVLKEIDALYKLKKYRTLKRRYYDANDGWR